MDSTMPYFLLIHLFFEDFVFIDGGHTLEIAEADILNFFKLAAPGAAVVLDNCNLWGIHNSPGGIDKVNKAYEKALSSKRIKHFKQVSVGTCTGPAVVREDCAELCVGKYLNEG
jgi:hypothetical protein